MLGSVFEVLDLIKMHGKTHNELDKGKISALIMDRLTEIETRASEADIALPAWFPELIGAYRNYHKEQSGIDQLKWKARILDLLELMEREEGL